jgi:hypothetical protein
LSLFCIRGTIQKISILQKKQEGGSILHMTKASRGRISPPPLLGYIWGWSYHLCMYHGEP